MSQAIIEVNNLVKRYRKAETNAVDGVSFSVEEGEFFAFLGPNGAGKTTTISILTTTLSKSGGTVKIAGFDVEHESTKVRDKIGIIFQNPSLDLNLTAEENIRLHASMYGVYSFSPFYTTMSSDYKKKINELAEILSLETSELSKPVKGYSGGMKRKLEIIRSLLHNPKVLFLDEPTTGLDPASRRGLWQYLNDVRKQTNVTIFLTTHYLEEAEGSDHLAIINHGKIVEYGSPSEIKEKLIDKYLLIDSRQRERLLQELDSKKIGYDIDKYVKIDLPEDRDDAHKIIKSIDTPLSTIVVHDPTLEEAYLDIISNGEDA